jgi:hypothetical protein
MTVPYRTPVPPAPAPPYELPFIYSSLLRALAAIWRERAETLGAGPYTPGRTLGEADGLRAAAVELLAMVECAEARRR